MKHNSTLLFKLAQDGTAKVYETRFIEKEYINTLAEQEKQFIKRNLEHDALYEIRLQRGEH